MNLYKHKNVPSCFLKADLAGWLEELGLVAVPIEPTPEMLAAARDCRLRDIHDMDWRWWDQGYKAMIKAAGETQ